MLHALYYGSSVYLATPQHRNGNNNNNDQKIPTTSKWKQLCSCPDCSLQLHNLWIYFIEHCIQMDWHYSTCLHQIDNFSFFFRFGTTLFWTISISNKKLLNGIHIQRLGWTDYSEESSCAECVPIYLLQNFENSSLDQICMLYYFLELTNEITLMRNVHIVKKKYNQHFVWHYSTEFYNINNLRNVFAFIPAERFEFICKMNIAVSFRWLEYLLTWTMPYFPIILLSYHI